MGGQGSGRRTKAPEHRRTVKKQVAFTPQEWGMVSKHCLEEKIRPSAMFRALILEKIKFLDLSNLDDVLEKGTSGP